MAQLLNDLAIKNALGTLNLSNSTNDPQLVSKEDLTAKLPLATNTIVTDKKRPFNLKKVKSPLKFPKNKTLVNIMEDPIQDRLTTWLQMLSMYESPEDLSEIHRDFIQNIDKFKKRQTPAKT